MKISRIKKILAIVLVVALCILSTTATVSAKLSKPTNTIKTNGNGGKTDIGMWYVTYNNSRQFVSNFGTGFPIKYRMLMPDGSYGILDSSNVEYIDFQLKQLAEAKVDFVLFDLTNGGLTSKVPFGWHGDENGNPSDQIILDAQLACERIAKWNQSNSWKIRYAIAVGTYSSLAGNQTSAQVAEAQAEAVYNLFYQNKTYGKDHYTMDGKPLLVLFDWTKSSVQQLQQYRGLKTYCEKFTVRDAIQGHKGTYGWQAQKGAVVDDEVILISPGHDNSAGSESVNIPRDNGKFYQKCWETILTNKLPRIVMISSFNDYHEQTAVFTADSSKCKDGYEAKWYDQTGKINNSMYWDMTKDGIRLIRGANGEIKTEMKSMWFDLGNGKLPFEGNDNNNGDKNSNPSSSQDTNGINTDVTNPAGEDTKTAKSNTAIIIVIVVTVIVILGAAITIFVVLKRKNKK